MAVSARRCGLAALGLLGAWVAMGVGLAGCTGLFTNAAITGSVVSAAATTVCVPGARLTLAPTTGGAAVASAVSDAKGAYLLAGCAPGSYGLTVEPPASTGLATATIPVTLGASEDLGVTVALAPASVTVGSLTVHPAGAELDHGMMVDFTATVRTEAGDPIDLEPTWVVGRRVGVITARGVFTARRSGEGWVTATLGTCSTTAPITVYGAEEDEE